MIGGEMSSRKEKYTVWLLPEIKDHIEREGEKLGQSLGEVITAMIMGQKIGRFVAPAKPTENQLLRGTSLEHKGKWRRLRLRFQALKQELFKGDDQQFMEVFGDLVRESQEILESRDEKALEKFFNSGRLAARRAEYLRGKRTSHEMAEIARDVFKRAAEGRLDGE